MADSIRFRPMIMDILKWSVVLFVVHILWFFVAPSRNTLLAPQFIGMFLFIISGLVAYWLVVDPHRNSIYPEQLGESTIDMPDCSAEPEVERPRAVPDNF